jgi:hypothetical protein
LKLCKDCKFIVSDRENDFYWSRCTNPIITQKKLSAVAKFITGDVEIVTKLCTSERGEGKCGKKAKYFTKKERGNL